MCLRKGGENMSLKKWLPEKRYGDRGISARSGWDSPLLSFQKEINRMFDDLFDGFPLTPLREKGEGFFVPRVNVSETDKEIKVSAELPGMDEKDIEVLLDRGVLTIKGEKKEEKEDQDGNYHYMERSSGSFHRELPVPEGVDHDKINASFKKGVLRVTIPLLPEAQSERKSIPIKSE